MSRITELEKQITELDERKVALRQELELEIQKTEIEYPFEENDLYWSIDIDGDLFQDQWNCSCFDKNCFKLGNAFKTEQEAIKERDKRILLTRFRQFRDKCNGDWKPDFKDNNSQKNYISFSYNDNMMKIYSYANLKEFNLFGYFKNGLDAKRAIELFGDEIKRLYVEE